jgi:hypothetical protein
VGDITDIVLRRGRTSGCLGDVWIIFTDERGSKNRDAAP